MLNLKPKTMNTLINIKVSELKLHKSYSNLYSVKSPQLELLIESIKETKGLLTPIVVNKNNEIINGVQRWLAYKELKWNTIPCTIIPETDPSDEIFLMISYNRHKDKTILERWHEVKYLKSIYGKRKGERTDLNPFADSTSTRRKIANIMHISESNVYKLEKVATHNIELLALIDTKEISLHEAYERVTKKTTIKKDKNSSNEITIEKPRLEENCTCPKCGHKFIN